MKCNLAYKTLVSVKPSFALNPGMCSELQAPWMAMPGCH